MCKSKRFTSPILLFNYWTGDFDPSFFAWWLLSMLTYQTTLLYIIVCDVTPQAPVASRYHVFCLLHQGGRKNGLFSPSTASLPAFSSLTPNVEESSVSLRPSCTLGPESAIVVDSPSTTGTTFNQGSWLHLTFKLALWFSGWLPVFHVSFSCKKKCFFSCVLSFTAKQLWGIFPDNWII